MRLLLLLSLLVMAVLPAQAAPLRVVVLSTDFVMPAKINALDAIGQAGDVHFTHQLATPGQPLPPQWLQGVDLVLLDTPRPADVEQLQALAAPQLDAASTPWVRIGGGPPAHGNLQPAQAARIAGYYGNGGQANYRTLVRWLQAWHAGAPADSLPAPQLMGASGFYAGPDAPLLADAQALQAHWQQQGASARPKVAVIIAAGTIGSLQTQVLDALIASGHQRGLEVFGTWFDQQRDDGLRAALEGIEVTAVVNLTHLQNGKGRSADFSALDVPVIQSLNHRQGNAAQWRTASSGVPMPLLATFVALPEGWGVIDPIVLSANEGGATLPIAEQVQALTGKLERIARLRSRPAADKHLALLFWNSPDGEKNLSASNLNVPRSIASMLPRLAAAGYRVRSENEAALIEQAQALLGGYYRPQTLDTLLKRDLAVAFPVARYQQWLAQLPEPRRRELVEQWGDPAQHPAVRRIGGTPSFILPRLQLGNLLLMPQPPRAGQVGQATHDMASVPSHYYLAAYLYLREGWKADAFIHFGTHGTQEWTPGKDRGLWAGDYPWLAVGDVPVFYPYIQDNVGEAIQAKRRGRAVIISHQTPAFAPSGLYDELRDMHQLIHEYQQLDDGPVRDATATQLQDMARKAGIAGDMGWNAVDMQTRFPAFLLALHDHLHALARRQLPLGLHTFGEPAGADERLLTVMQQLGPAYLRALGLDPEEANAGSAQDIRAAPPFQTLHRYLRGGADIEQATPQALRTQLQRAHALDAALTDTQEMESLLHGLAGGHVLPGAGGDPVRSPEVRSGRNLYAFEPDRIPTRAAFESGRVALDQLIAAYRGEHGGVAPEKLAISLWSGEAIRHMGVLEAQVLHAMGLRPRWDEAGKVVALDIVPDAELTQPRIDVVVQATSVYRDQFDPFMRLLADAVARLSQLPATRNNPIARNTEALRQTLRQRGVDDDRALALAQLRIFSNSPGNYGSGLNHAVLERAEGAAKNDAALANGFLERLQYGYDAHGKVQTLAGGNLFAEQLHGVQAAVLARSSNLHGLLSTDHPFEYLGGLALAVRHLDGSTPALYVSDLRQNTPATRGATRFLADELRSGMLNPQWIDAMKQEGYAGTLSVLKTTDNLFGWQVTDPGSVRAEQWQAVHDTYVRDIRNRGIAQWFEQHNPTAQMQLIKRLQEAISRGYWEADTQTRNELQQRLQALEAAASADTPALPQPQAPAPAAANTRAAAGFGLQAPGTAPAANPAAAAAAASPDNAATPPAVRGRVMRKHEAAPPAQGQHTLLAVLALLLLTGLGAWLQSRSTPLRSP